MENLKHKRWPLGFEPDPAPSPPPPPQPQFPQLGAEPMTATMSSGPGTREHEAGLHETFSNSSCHPQLRAGEGRELQMVRLRLLQLPSPPPCQTGKAQGFNSPQTTHLFPGKLKLKAQTVFCLRMPPFQASRSEDCLGTCHWSGRPLC